MLQQQIFLCKHQIPVVFILLFVLAQNHSFMMSSKAGFMGLTGNAHPFVVVVVPRKNSVGCHAQNPKQHKGEKQQQQQQQEQELTGIVFKNDYEQVQLQVKEEEQKQQPSARNIHDPSYSLARMHFSDRAQASVNEQINVELNISYVYLSMSSYFQRDTISLPGLSRYFYEQSEEEREHAQSLMNFLNTRGGRVKLKALVAPESEFYDEHRGDALLALELSLSLEKLNYDKLLQLWEVMDKEGDAQAVQFVEYMLEKQAEDVKKVADYVSQLRRIGGTNGFGVWQFDHEMY